MRDVEAFRLIYVDIFIVFVVFYLAYVAGFFLAGFFLLLTNDP